MNPYEVKFDGNDVFKWFSRLFELGRGDREDALVTIILHELSGGFTAVDQQFMLFSEELLDYPTKPTKEQIDLVEQVISAGKGYNNSTMRIYDFCRSNASPADDLREACEDLVGTLTELSSHLPFSAYIPKMASLADKRAEALQEIDFCYNMVFYLYNKIFCSESELGPFYLARDLDYLHTSLSMQKALRMGCCAVCDIETKVDYFTNAIMPLIANIRDHAGNPKNNIYDKPKSKLPGIYFQITHETDELGKVITIRVKDWGFGMEPEIKIKLFERGASTKTGEEHGTGLWGVKRFVERNGGNIWCETELGNGTSFYFTIPFTSKRKHVYVQ